MTGQRSTEAGGEPLPIVVTGHVDHGKSTLVGRLLHDTGALTEGRIEAIRESCRRRGVPFEWAFLLDALQAERDQGITIDTTRIRFDSAQRSYVIIDAPGHKEFLKNMVSGAASAEAALLVVDAAEGVREQSRRHAYILRLLGLRQIVVAVNKIDLVGYGQARFDEVAGEITEYLAGLDVTPAAVIPVSARAGDNIATGSGRMPWYCGPTVLEALDAFPDPAVLAERPLRLPVQDVYKFDHRRIIVGRIESGRIAVGDELVFQPSGKRARVASIEDWNVDTPRVSAAARQSVAVTLDEQIFVERGEVASPAQAPAPASHFLNVRLFWLGRRPLKVGDRYTLKLATARRPVTVAAIDRVIDIETLAGGPGEAVVQNGIAEIVLHSRAPIVADAFSDLPPTGRGVLLDGYDVVGGCIISGDATAAPAEAAVKSDNLQEVAHAVTTLTRAQANGHRGGVVWLTGLSGAGKSTLAMALERALFARGRQVFVLDGDNLRHRLNADLGFSAADRSENIRRAAETAALFADAGFIVVTAFISPSREDRARARAAAGGAFNEVHVSAELAVCEARDPKGLYARARAGEIADFTGVSAPYEAPLEPDLGLDTGKLSVEECLGELLAYVDREFTLEADKRGVAAA